jgi:integrase
MAPKGKRPRVRIVPEDEKFILTLLERWATETGEFVALRTRAFVLLLWDGSIRTKAALALNAEDVVQDPKSRRITVRKNVIERPCEENRYRKRSFVLSERTRAALTDYLRAVRAGGWLPSERLEGPLFLSSTERGKGQRLSARSAIHWWDLFQSKAIKGTTREYQLDDVVYTGRLAYLEASGGDSESLSDHSGISRRWAAEYRSDHKLSPAEVMAKLDKRR